MIDALRQSFDRQMSMLCDEVSQDWRWPSPDAAFAWYISRLSNIPLPGGCPVDLGVFNHATFDQAPALASAGFVLACSRPQMHGGYNVAWIEGLRRLAGRKVFTLDRQSFAYRPYEVLGIAVGVAAFSAAPEENVSFINNVVSKLREDESTSTWARLLALYAGARIGVGWSSRLWCDIQDLDLCELALLRWMMSDQGVATSLHVQNVEQNSVTALLLERGLTRGALRQDVGRSFVLHTSLEASLRQALGSALIPVLQTGSALPHIIDIVRRLCERFPLYVRQMQKRHASRESVVVQDEYDVQDLLHALLVLHFSDVRPEEWTPSYGGTNTRMDFLLKAEQVVIEVKMTRKGLDQKKILEELAVDKMRYRSHPDCRSLVCFVYDPDGHCHNPVALERDASEVSGEFQVAVIVAPKGM